MSHSSTHFALFIAADGTDISLMFNRRDQEPGTIVYSVVSGPHRPTYTWTGYEFRDHLQTALENNERFGGQLLMKSLPYSNSDQLTGMVYLPAMEVRVLQTLLGMK